MNKVFRFIIRCVLISLIVLIVVGTTIGIGLAIYIEKNVEKTIDEKIFTSVGNSGESTIYYYDFEDRENRIGEAHELTSQKIYGGYNCKYIQIESIPRDLVNAYIAIEDKRFYEHSGVDWKRSISAGFNYFLQFSDSFGGSTITQQLIKNVTQKDDYSFQRKIQEILWALDLETKMTKEEILEMYLNIINLSQGCYGVGAAAEYYFSKSVNELTLEECACIAAITNSPTYYNPIKNPDNNKERRNVILTEMYAQGYIDKEKYDNAYDADIELNVSTKSDPKTINSWYTDMVIEDVISDLEAQGYSRHMANLIVYTGGLKIYVAMDKDMQDKVEEYYENTKNFYKTESGDDPQSSIIIIDTKTGDILAVAGAVGEKQGNRIQNFATQTRRPAGSVIKPLSVYAPALDSGIINWSSVYDDTPVNFGSYNLDVTKGEIIAPVAWPVNSNGIYRGLTNINYAIEHSTNTVSVKTLMDVGVENSFDFLYEKLEMHSLIKREELANGNIISDIGIAALSLGQFNRGVTLREVSAGYSIFANDGIYNRTRSYLRVIDSRGNELLKNDYHGQIAISQESADIMTLMLENVIKNGTATSVDLDKYIDCAGKTGTTQNNYDKWFIGYTPEYICGVWYGYEYPKPITDGNKALKIWNDIMSEIYKDNIKSGERSEFEIGENIVRAEYCSDSGKLMTTACRQDARGDRSEWGYFVSGSEPNEFCDCHVLVAYDNQYGGVAGDDCHRENVVYVGLVNVERSFPVQIYITDAQYVWRDIGASTPPSTAINLPFFANLLHEGEYSGISKGDRQYNRYCRYDFNYQKWYQ